MLSKKIIIHEISLMTMGSETVVKQMRGFEFQRKQKVENIPEFVELFSHNFQINLNFYSFRNFCVKSVEN